MKKIHSYFHPEGILLANTQARHSGASLVGQSSQITYIICLVVCLELLEKSQMKSFWRRLKVSYMG